MKRILINALPPAGGHLRQARAPEALKSIENELNAG